MLVPCLLINLKLQIIPGLKKVPKEKQDYALLPTPASSTVK